MVHITGYFSHPIRGKKGDAATDEDIRLNNDIASVVARSLQTMLPGLTLYVPGDHDDVPTLLLKRGDVSIDQLLDADCTLLDQQDILVIFNPEHGLSQGMQTEVYRASDLGKPLFRLFSLADVPAVASEILNWYRKEHADA